MKKSVREIYDDIFPPPEPVVLIQNFMSKTPSQIPFPDGDQSWKLYLGSINAARDAETLKAKSIKAVLSICEASPSMGEEIEKCFFPVRDSPHYDLMGNHFEECFAFLEKQRRAGINTLVHCQVGASRSATIVLAYLMKRYSISLEDASVYLRKLRSIVCPNLGFLRQLRAFEENGYNVVRKAPIPEPTVAPALPIEHSSATEAPLTQIENFRKAMASHSSRKVTVIEGLNKTTFGDSFDGVDRCFKIQDVQTSSVTLSGKGLGVSMLNCKASRVVVDSIVAKIDLYKCNHVDVTIHKYCPAIQFDNCENCVIHLEGTNELPDHSDTPVLTLFSKASQGICINFKEKAIHLESTLPGPQQLCAKIDSAGEMELSGV